MFSNDLGKDKIVKLVFALAIPSMIAQLINVLYSIVDRMFIGNIPVVGEIALAGVGVCGPIITLLSSFGTLVGLGGSILMAMKLGAGEKKEARDILSNSFTMLVVLSLTLTVLFLLFKSYLIVWFGGAGERFVYANEYLTIYTMGTFFALMAMGLNYFISCQGYSVVGMITVVLGAVTNIVLDYVFVVLLGKGVAGAAWATVIAQFFSFLFAFCFLLSKHSDIRLTFGQHDFSVMKKIVKLGISPFLILASDSVIIIAMNAIVQLFAGDNGSLMLSSLTIVQSYFLLITGPLLGLTSGTQAIISYNFGAREFDRVRQAEKIILICSVVFCVTMMIVSNVFAINIVNLFTREPEYVDLSIRGIKIFTMALIPMAFQYALVDGLTALGKIKVSLFLSMFRKCTYVLATILIPLLFSYTNIFYAQPVADTLAGINTTIFFWLVFEKHLKFAEEAKYRI